MLLSQGGCFDRKGGERTRKRIKRKRIALRIIFAIAIIFLFGWLGVGLAPMLRQEAEHEVTPLPTVEPVPTPSPSPSPTPTPTPTPSSTPSPHQHKWRELSAVEKVEEQGHWETVLLSGEWTEEIQTTGYVCTSCGAGFGDAGSAEGHVKSSHGAEGRYYQITSAQSVYHPAVYDRRWVVDKPAEEKTVVIGEVCEECGETKERSFDENKN